MGLVAAERHSHLAEEGPALFIRTGSGHDGDVHAPDGVDLVEGDLREDDLLSYPQGVIATSVEAFGADATEVTDAGQCQVDQSLQEGVHAIAAQSHGTADRHAFRILKLAMAFLARVTT